MRYIGNKTRLLSFILRTIDRLGIPPGHAHDAFAGTAAVGRALKAQGWRVASSDLMAYAYVFQRAYVVASRIPSFARLAAAHPELGQAIRAARRSRAGGGQPGNGAAPSPSPGLGALRAVATHLAERLEPHHGLLSRHFAPAGGRMYFTEENAGRIDAARHAIERWRRDGAIDDDAYYLLLAGILEGADRVANTAGVYAAYIKSWQPNALRPFAILPEPPVPGRGSTAARADADDTARALGPIDLLYIDPPYNNRQYASYYHIPELLAGDAAAAASDGLALRGKTGLPSSTPELRSRWCSRRDAPGALRSLLAATGARHVLVSYNTEGVLPDAELRAILRDGAIDGRVRRFTRPYRRYRADSDHDRRRYKGDWVRELLYYARLR
jgi:adenine-specific DNA-methyltransferase